MSDSLDVHNYDARIDTNILPDLILLKQLPLEEKKLRGHELIKICKEPVPEIVTNIETYIMNQVSISFLENIVADIGTSANIDHSNNLVADDLICIAWIYRYNVDFLRLLETQLLDMETGFCPQGRTHRLFQTIISFIN